MVHSCLFAKRGTPRAAFPTIFSKEEKAMEKGRITQVIGPVIDVEFGAGKLPMIRDALTVEVDGK